MPLRPPAAALLAAIVILAAPAARAVPPRCQGTVAGAVSGTFACEVMARSTDGGVRLTVTPTEDVPGLKALGPFTVDVAGRLTTRTFAGDDLGAATVTAEGQDGVRYAAAKGAVTLTVTQLEREQRGGWYVAGSLSATLAAAGGAGSLTVAVGF
jgi:hypothetical protein